MDKEQRVTIFKETIHNLVKSTRTGMTWFIDNESALLDGYSQLYENPDDVRFIGLHEQLLHTVCIFRKQTIDRLFMLQKSSDPAKLLLRFINDNEPLFRRLPTIHPNSIFVRHFSERLQQVLSWVQRCQRIQY